MTTQVRPSGARAERAPVSGRIWQHAEDEVVDGKYRLVRPLGRGGMAEVWLATHVHLKTEVAVKFLSAALVRDPDQALMVLQRFQFEAQISARLGSRTRHVVAVHDAGMHDDMPYLVMEYVPGRTLVEEIAQRGPMDLLRLADLLDQIADALGVAHEMGIVHRDIKPSNVLLMGEPGSEPRVKLADFGIAKALGTGLDFDRPNETSSTMMLGSPSYMSPEQIRAPASVNARSDIWSLGILTYEALTNGSPFNGTTMGEVMISVSTQRFERPSMLRPSLPPAVDQWFARVLAKEASDRFASVTEMARSFREAVTTTVEAPPSRPQRRRAVGAVLVAALAVAVLLGVAWKVFDAPQPAVPEARLLSSVLRLPRLQPSAQPPAPPPPAVPPEAPAAAMAPARAASGRHQPSLSGSTHETLPPPPAATAAPPPAVPSREPPRRKEIDKSEIL